MDMKFGFLCSVFRVGWRIFVGGVFGCGGGIGSLWVAFLNTTAEFSGEIWQRNLTMVKNKPLIVAADNMRPPPGI